MPPMRPLSRCLRLPHVSSSTLRAPIDNSNSLTSAVRARTLASSHAPDGENAHSSHESHDSPYDPPGGWLFGVRPGEKYQKEGWEGLFIYGYCGTLLLTAVLYAYKPDTSIQTWALEEARRRLEKEGILEDPFPENGEQPRPRRYYEARDE